MSFQARHQNLVSSSDSLWPPIKPFKAYNFNGKFLGFDHRLYKHCLTRKKVRLRLFHSENAKLNVTCRSSELRKRLNGYPKLRTIEHVLPLASADDGVTVNRGSQVGSRNEFEEMRYKLNESLLSEDQNAGLVQLLHDAARIFERKIRERNFLSKKSWFSTAWLGVDKIAWAKELSYQASVYSLLQAANEISSRGDRRDRDVNVFVQRSLSRQSAPLESVIRDKLSAKQPVAYDWFWSEQMPAAVTSFVNYLENERFFAPATSVYKNGLVSESGNSRDMSLLMLALSCIASIMKLGPTKVSCAQFSSLIPDVTGRLMDTLVHYVPIHHAYPLIKDIGMRREFLVHFGPRAATCRTKNEFGDEEMVFWVGLVQKQLQQAIAQERIWSRLTTSESIEVLERDLAIFGFFIALGTSTQSFLIANGVKTMDEPIEGFIRYLIGGSVLYYPQLSAISSYQLYVEVVCEELEWLPFYPGISSASKRNLEHKKREERAPNKDSIPLVLEICSHWIESFIRCSKWLENPSNVKAARFLSKGHLILRECMEELGTKKDHAQVYEEAESFDKALGSIEEALLRLEELLQQLHVSSSRSGKEHLKAACSDLERIRRLKKEAEFMEASFRAKAASLQQGKVVDSKTSKGERRQLTGRKGGKGSDVKIERGNELRGIVARRLDKSSDTSSSVSNDSDDSSREENVGNERANKPESNEFQRFELLRNELMELEKRVQKSTDIRDYEEDETQVKDDGSRHGNDTGSNSIVQKKDSIIGKSLAKLKETSTDVLQGTQLLAIDTAAAMGLLRRALIGDELTEKEKHALRRTCTDLASVVPIGILMLLPVTAVGHAAMLAAIQRYVPSLIPSTYGAERLNLLRQLEKVKEMEGVILDDNADGEPSK